MKKMFVIAVLALATIACHRKTAASTSESTKAMEVPQPSAAEVELIAHGKTVYTNRCGRCHDLKNTLDFTPKQWEGILESMIPKAKLNEAEGKQVTAYVMANAKK